MISVSNLGRKSFRLYLETDKYPSLIPIFLVVYYEIDLIIIERDEEYIPIQGQRNKNI